MENRSVESAWAREYERYEADLAFMGSRLRAAARIVGGLVTSIVRREPARPIAGRTSVPLSAIVGIVDARGKKLRRIPLLKRGMAEAWRRAYWRTDAGVDSVLPVLLGKGGWYLAGGASALLTLELIRDKGCRVVPVRPLPVQEIDGRGETAHGEDECCEVCAPQRAS